MRSLFAKAHSAFIVRLNRPAGRRRAQAGARPLTSGEIAMARTIFQDAIDYARVRIFSKPYLPFGLQPANVAMAPNGNIYFNDAGFREDFSREPNHLRHWFLHEMVHVWQHQLRYPVMRRGALRVGLAYAYALAPGKRLRDYNMEAQGELLADYFALKYLQDVAVMAQSAYAGALAEYEDALAEFFADRKDPRNLPRRVWQTRR